MIDLPVASPWFVRERVSDTLTLVTEPHVHPLLRCNVWHVQGRDSDLVVDTALGLRPLRQFVERELDGGLLAVATHTYGDHVGGMHEFADRAVHRAEAHELDRGGSAVLDPGVFGEEVLGPYRDAGYDIPELLSTRCHRAGSRPVCSRSRPRPPRRVARRRRRDRPRRPGASRCCTCRATRRGASVCGRPPAGSCSRATPCTTGRSSTSSTGSDVAAYVATMRRLRDLPVTVVHGGHEPSFGRERLVAICTDYLDRHDA